MHRRHYDDKVLDNYEKYDEYERERLESENKKIEPDIEPHIDKATTSRIKYMYPEYYETYEKYLDFSKSSIIKRKKEDILNMESFWLDQYCKIEQVRLASDEKGYKAINELINPKKGARKIIGSKGNGEWRSYLPDSIIADALGQSFGGYKLEGVEDLLCHTIPCALLADDCVQQNNIGKVQMFWHTVQIIIMAYDSGRSDVVLSRDEKNNIVESLLDEKLYKHNQWLERRRITKEDLKESNEIKSATIKYEKVSKKDREYLKGRLADIKAKHLSDEECGKLQLSTRLTDSQRMKFASYLIPIAASFYAYYKENPFFVKDTAWKRLSVKRIDGLQVSDVEAKKLAEYYTKMSMYTKYHNQLELLGEQEDLHISYETFCRLMIQKINIFSKNTLISYYAMERLLGFQFVEAVSTMILNIIEQAGNKNENAQLKYQDYASLFRMLEICFDCGGVFSRISIAKIAIQKYFTETKEGNVMSRNTEIRNHIRKYKKKFEKYELQFIRLASCENEFPVKHILERLLYTSNCSHKIVENLYHENPMWAKNENIYFSKPREKFESIQIEGAYSRLRAYTNCVERMKEINRNEGEIENKEITVRSMRNRTKQEIDNNWDVRLCQIKKWVISRVILGENISSIDFVK